jgi:hypothetical protein
VRSCFTACDPTDQQGENVQTQLNHDAADMQKFVAACEPDLVLGKLAASPNSSWARVTAALNHDAADLQRFATQCNASAVLAEVTAGPRGSWVGLTTRDH